jgi:3-oxoacyl-[acyl-carrier-protein] synthase II
LLDVAITGLGVVSPLGNEVGTFWESLCCGASGIAPITRFDASPFRNRTGGEVKDFQPAERDRSMARAYQYAAGAVRDAWKDSGLAGSADSLNAGIVTATNFGSAELGRNICESVILGKPELPPVAPQWQMDWLTNRLADEFGLPGPRATISLSCASGVASIGQAFSLIRARRARAVIACGYDELSFYAFSGLSALRAMTPEIIRPFDINRKGTIFSEGAGALVLEALDSARARGARIYATVLGHAMNNDAYHMTAPDKTGRGIISVMKDALADANVDPDEIDHINAHGTGTPFNDKTETTAIKEIFGERAYNIPVNSMKSMMGHCMGAAGSLETIGAALTALHGIIPPTVNLETPDPECDLDYVPGTAREMKVKIVLCNSYGFGGTNAALVLRRWD